MIQRQRDRSSQNNTATLEICLITVRYPSDDQWSSFCVKEFEVNKNVYNEALASRATRGGQGSLAVVRDSKNPKVARTVSSIEGYLTPCCVISTLIVYGLIFTFMVRVFFFGVGSHFFNSFIPHNTAGYMELDII